MKKYEAPMLWILRITAVDVVTSSIERDEGTNDGEWTPYLFKDSDRIGE